MGINDRDYYRQVTRGSHFLTGTAPVCRQLIVANIVVFVAQLLSQGNIERWFGLNSLEVVYHGQVWRLLTYAFCHEPGSLFHLLFNMLGLWFFGAALEALYGSREFLLFYLTAAVVAGLANVGLEFALRDFHLTIGASGSIMAIMMLYALYYPTHQFIVFIFPVEARWLVTGYVILDLFPVLQSLGGRPHPDGVAHAAHLGGLAYGYLYKTFDLRFGSLFSGDWNLSRRVRDVFRRRQMRVYHPPDPIGSKESVQDRVDQILEKISGHGEASLTDQERQFLKDASRRYKKP